MHMDYVYSREAPQRATGSLHCICAALQHGISPKLTTIGPLSNQLQLIFRFRATGDHLPVGPAPAAHAAAPAVAPTPRFIQTQQQAHVPHFPAAQVASFTSNDYEDGQYDERWNDPTFQGHAGRVASAPVHQAPAPVHHHQHQQQQPQYVQEPAPQPQYVAQPAAPQQQPQYVPQQAYYPTTTTPSPHRFQPPGKLALSRTPDGFSFSFNKV